MCVRACQFVAFCTGPPIGELTSCCARADVEEITHKTGSFKKFNVFVSMLRSALRHEGGGVHLDVLTYTDLQALKSRKAATATGCPVPTATLPAMGNEKRYLILTYASQYDR